VSHNTSPNKSQISCISEQQISARHKVNKQV